jgi:molecular chaperone DnaK (HSP70)
VRVKEGVATPISTEGVPQLGGRDFTKVVQRILLEKVSKEIGKTITLDKLAGDQAAELWGKAENAKHSLSAQPSTKVALNCGGKSRLIEVTKAEFEAACAPFVKQMKECMDRALKAAGVTWTQLEKLVLAGGPFHSPWLQEEVAVHTGLVPAVQIDPTNVVSFGAALHGFALARKEGGVGFLPDRPILQEATAHDVGVGVIDETSGSREPRCAVIVPKNTPIPHTAPPFLYRLERPSQTEVFIEILQGSEGAPASKCARIGTIHLKGLPVEKQRTERIEITFKFDNNTLVTVTARDTISGISHSVGVTLGK